MRHTHLLAAVALATALIGSAGAASAANGTLSAPVTGASPIGTFGRFSNGGVNCTVTGIASRRYELRTVTVSTTGDYAFEDWSDDDGILGIYSGAFTPADSAQNCVGGIDDSRTVTLAAGTYTLLYSTYDPASLQTVSYSYTGPGTITVGAAPAAVPTLTEWAMIALAMLLAGAGALTIGRNRFQRA